MKVRWEFFLMLSFILTVYHTSAIIEMWSQHLPAAVCGNSETQVLQKVLLRFHTRSVAHEIRQCGLIIQIQA